MARARLGASYWRLFASSATSNLADGIGRTATPLLAASLTRDPVLVSGLATMTFVPWLLFALVSGALVDRSDRRRAMVVANVARAVVVGGLGIAVAIGAAGIVVLYVAAFLLGTLETVYDSAARAILPTVVDRERLDAVNGHLGAVEQIGQNFLGAPVGGVLFALLAAAPFLANAGGFIFAAVLAATLPGTFRVHGGAEPRARLRTEIAAGVRWLRGHTVLRRLALVTAGTTLTATMADALIVLYVLDELDLPEAAFGGFIVAAGIGAILGSVVAPLVGRRLGRATCMAGALLVGGAMYVVLGLTTQPVLAAAGFAAYGTTVMVWNVLSMSLRQALIPEALFGRVQGAWRTLVWGAIPVGAVLGGVLARMSGVRPAFVVSGMLQAALAVAAWRTVRSTPAASAPGDIAVSDTRSADVIPGE